MKVSLQTIKQLIDFELPPVDELVQRINAQLGGVEEVTYLSEKYGDAVIVKVVECEKHPDADKLSICKIDVGAGELVQVVCGAPNVDAGMWAIWLPPKSTVPSTYGTDEPFVLGARELRGVMSHGMLAAGDELGINNDHDGIIDVTERDIPKGEELKAGASFAEVFGLNDTIIDIENKMFTHRPDLFGQLGVAREIAGIFGHQFTSPEWYKKVEYRIENSENSDMLPFEVFNDASEKAPRFMAVAIKDVTVGPSPLWLQCQLVRLGGKSINNIVDITNYVMLLTSQPTHAYDYDKLRGHKLGVRMAHEGEKATLLNGKTYELAVDDIVIVDGEGPVGLAGIMGGGNSEVSPETKNIVLEVANFDMYAVRKSSMRHGIFTDALARFNKGQSPLQNPIVLRQLQKFITGIADGRQASEVFDIHSDSLDQAIEANEMTLPLTIEPSFIRDRLGLDITKDAMVMMLGNVEFPLCEDCGWNPDDTQDSDDELHINVPFWRMDIEDPEDIVEEVGRLYGFEKLPRELPTRSAAPTQKNPYIEIKRQIRESLSRAGANEVLTYSFVHEHIFKKSEQDAEQAFRLSNALSPDLQYYRLSVLPSLLDKVHPNIKAGHDEFVLFEIGKGHNKKFHASDDQGLPKELQFVDAVYASKKSREGAAYYHIQKLVTELARTLGFALKFAPVNEPLDYPVTAPFDLQRSALVESESGEFVGMIGELKQSVIRNFKLPAYTSAMTLDLEGVMRASSSAKERYKPLSRFPKVTQDISLKVSVDTHYAAVYEAVQQSIDTHKNVQSDVTLEPRSVYRAEGDTTHKTITLRLMIASYEKTLTDKDVNRLLEQVAVDVGKTLGAERI